MDIHPNPLIALNHKQRAAVLSAREDDPASTQQTTIIIAATVSVGGLVLILIAFRFLRRWYKAKKLKPTPLPPVQPLAHEREQQLARFEAAGAQPPTWYEASLLSAPGFLGSTPSAGSKASLLGRRDSDIPSRIPSQLSVEDAAALSGPPMQLDAPQPHFHNIDVSPSSTSLGSMDDIDGPYTPDSGTIPSTTSHSSYASRQRSVSASSARPRSHHPGRSRPGSMVSTIASTTYSRKTMHGLPHGPHSQVQIVLPAPLAPLASNGLGNEIGRQSVYSEVEYRKSIVDQWASTAVSGSNSMERGSSRSRSITSEFNLAIELIGLHDLTLFFYLKVELVHPRPPYLATHKYKYQCPMDPFPVDSPTRTSHPLPLNRALAYHNPHLLVQFITLSITQLDLCTTPAPPPLFVLLRLSLVYPPCIAIAIL